MQAVNYPRTPASPLTQHVDPHPALPEPAGNRPPLVGVVVVGGVALSLVLGGFLIGSLPIGRTIGPSLPDAGLSGFAEMYVATLLTQAGAGAEDVLAPFLGYAPDLTGFEPGTWYVTQTAVWSVEAAGTDSWTVLVAATQLGLQEGGYAPAGTSFYEVGVERTPTGLRAKGLPMLVANPLPTASNYPGTPDLDERLSSIVAGFLTTHFTESNTTQFDKAPFVSVIVRSISTEEAEGDELEVDVEFLGIDAAGRPTPLAYRLEVSTIDWSIVEAGDVNQESG